MTGSVNETLNTKTKRILCLIVCIVLLLTAITTTVVYSCGTVMIRGKSIGLQTFLPMILSIARITGNNAVGTIVEVLLSSVYLAFMIVMIINLVNAIKRFVKFAISLKSESHKSILLMKGLFGCCVNILLFSSFFVFFSVLITESEMLSFARIYSKIMLLTYPLLVFSLNMIMDTKKVNKHLTLLAESIIGVACVLLIFDITCNSFILRSFRGLMVLFPEGASFDVILSNFTNFVSMPITYIVIAVCGGKIISICENNLSINEYNKERMRNKWIEILVFCSICFISVCVAYVCALFKSTDVSLDTFGILERWIQLGKTSQYVPLMLYATVGIIMNVFGVVDFKKRKNKA